MKRYNIKAALTITTILGATAGACFGYLIVPLALIWLAIQLINHYPDTPEDR